MSFHVFLIDVFISLQLLTAEITSTSVQFFVGSIWVNVNADGCFIDSNNGLGFNVLGM